MGVLDLSVTLHAKGDAPPEVVWERYADLDLWEQWSPQITGVESSGSRLRTGLEGRVVGPLGLRVPFRVTEVGIRSWVWEVRPFGIRLVLRHRVLARSAGAATELRIHGPAPAVLTYLPFAQLALRKLVAW